MRCRFLASAAAALACAGSVVAAGPPQAPAAAPAAAPPAVIDKPVPCGPSSGWWDAPPAGDWSGGSAWQVGLEYSFWYLPKTRNASVLAATDSLNNPQAVRLATLGDERLERRLTSGTRLTVGYWDYEDNPWVPGGRVAVAGAEVRAFAMADKSITFRNDSSPALVRPFFDLNNRRESGIIVALPGLATGGIAARAELDFAGVEANYWRNLYAEVPNTLFTFDVMAGFRYLNTDLEITSSRVSVYNQDLQAFPAFQFLAGNRITEAELIASRNHFYGGQVGVGGKAFADLFYLEATAKLAVGMTHQQLHIEGSQVQTLADGSTRVLPGALLALPTNIGRYSQDKLTFVPDLGVTVGIPVCRFITVTGAFNAIYWSRIVRPRDQIDRVIDVSQIPNFPGAGATPTGLQRPTVLFDQTDLWALGFHFGVQVTW